MSSTWRRGYYAKINNSNDIMSKTDIQDYDLLADKLSEHGLEIYSHTPLSSADVSCRGLVIHQWLRSHVDAPVQSIVILDDYNDMSPYGRFLVQTSPNKGLEQKHVLKAIKLLESNEYQLFNTKQIVPSSKEQIHSPKNIDIEIKRAQSVVAKQVTRQHPDPLER